MLDNSITPTETAFASVCVCVSFLHFLYCAAVLLAFIPTTVFHTFLLSFSVFLKLIHSTNG